ncbi:ABC transporter substrate-binding protein [Pediococcus siamensis]|uniref:ABC transporter substrate-binding protein n=1 Tax=Pediococcus siamensis TaxID=381829 RepID=UPI0039A31CB8
MKKFLSILGVLFISVILVSCGKVKSQGNSNTSNKELAIVIPAADHGWLSGVAYYAQKTAKELGLKKYKVITSSNVNDQASQLDELISQKVGAIVLEPHTNEVSVAAQKVVKAGIPLVVFDRKVDAKYKSFVAGSNPQIGSASANYLGKKLNGKGTIAVLNVPSSGSVSSERVGSFKKVMKKKYPNIKLVDMTADAYTQEEGLQTSKDMLTAHKHVDAIFSIDDECSLGILQALKETKRTDVKYLSGVGGSQAYFKKIKESNGNLTLFTATYSPSMISDAIKIAHKAQEGKNVDNKLVISPKIVTKANVSNYINSKSPY